MDSLMMADTRWRLSQASTAQLLELLWQVWDVLNRRLRFSEGPIAADTNAKCAITHVAFTVTPFTKRRVTRGTDHIAVSFMTKMDMTTL